MDEHARALQILNEVRKKLFQMEKQVLIKGLPGTGKTTVVKKFASKLKEMNVPVNGFYTEEVRDSNNSRIGFDIVTLNGQRAILARKGGESKHQVGAYSVYIENFERLALPIVEKPKKVIIIDEIGKMETLSRDFQLAVKKLLSNKEQVMVATVPSKGGGVFVSRLKGNSNYRIFDITDENRDRLPDVLIKRIL